MKKKILKKDIIKTIRVMRKNPGKLFTVGCCLLWAVKTYHRGKFTDWKWDYYGQRIGETTATFSADWQSDFADIVFKINMLEHR